MRTKIVLTSAIFGCLLIAPQAQANFFNILGTVNSTLNTIKQTKGELDNLTNSLGLNPGSVDLSGAETGSDIAIKLYHSWREQLTSEDQHLADQLVIDYATGVALSRENVAVTSWFQGLSSQKKMSVLGLFADFEKITNLVDDQSSFLAGIL